MSDAVSTPSTPTSTPAAPNTAAQTGNSSLSHSPQPGKSPSHGGSQAGITSPSSPPSSPLLSGWEGKIDGKQVKLSAEEVNERLSLSHVARQRLHEAAAMKRELEAREGKYVENPIEALKHYYEKKGYNPEQTREAIEKYYLDEYYRRDQMTAEQKENEELKKFKAQVEHERKQREDNERQTFEQKSTNEQINFVTEEITSALDSAQLPKGNKFLVQRMAFYMHENSKNGWNAPKEVVLQQVVREHKGIVNGFLNEASIEQIVNYAGQEFIDKILKYSLEKHRENRNKIQQPFASNQSDTPNPRGKIDMSEVTRRMNKMRRTGNYD